MYIAINIGELRNKIDCQGCRMECNQGYGCAVFGAKGPYERPEQCKVSENIYNKLEAMAGVQDTPTKGATK
jgi:hypothetical protein